MTNDPAGSKTRGPRAGDPALPSFKTPNTFPPVWLVAVVIVLAVSAAYLNSFSGVLVLDDEPHIIENERLRQLWPIREVVADTSRPLVILSLALNYAIGELNVWSYHAFNLIIHLFAALVLLGVVRRTLLFGRCGRTPGQSASWLAFAVALIWAVHPLQTGSVTYVIQRAESMMGLFYLLTLYCVIRGARSSRSRWWFAAAVSSCALGMVCKEVMITAPLCVVLYDRVFLSRSFGQMLRRRWGLYLGLVAGWGVLVASGVVRSVLFPPASAAGTVGFSCRSVTPLEYAASQPGVILHYLKLCFWPRSLCLDYGWPIAAQVWQIAPQSVAVGLLLVGTIWALWQKPWLGFLGASFFLVLAPTSSVIPIRDLAFEHRMYLPSASVVAVTVIGGYRLLRSLLDRTSLGAASQRRLLGILTAAAVLLLGYGTCRRNTDYRSPVTMWSNVVRKSPGNSRAHYNLGNELNAEGKVETAIHHYREAIRLNPSYAKAHYNLANTLWKRGKADAAIAHYRLAVRIEPDYAHAHFNLGVALALQGRIDEAIPHHHEALRIEPDYVKARCNLATIYRMQGRLDDAIHHYRRALKVQPDSSVVLNSLAWVLSTRADATGRESDEAVRLAERAAELTKHQDAAILDTLAAAYAAAGRFDRAVATAQAAIDLASAAATETLARDFRERLELYEQAKPYRKPRHARTQPSTRPMRERAAGRTP